MLRLRHLLIAGILGLALGAGVTAGIIYLAPFGGQSIASIIDSEQRAIGYIKRAQDDSGRLGSILSETKQLSSTGGTYSARLRFYADRIDAISGEWARLDKGLTEAIPEATD